MVKDNFPKIFETENVRIEIDKDGDIILGKKYYINESIQALYDAVELSRKIKDAKCVLPVVEEKQC